MKCSVLTVLLLGSLLVHRGNAQGAITTTINQIAATNPNALYSMGAQSFSEANFQALARAVGSIYQTLQTLTLPFISNQFNTYTTGIQNLNALVTALNSSQLKMNSTLNSQINSLNFSTITNFQNVNNQISRLSTSVAQLTANNCCNTVNTMSAQLTALINRNNIEHVAMNASNANLNSTIRIVNMTNFANVNAVKSSISNLDARLTGLNLLAVNNNSLTSARIDELNATFTQKFIDDQTPRDQLFTYYNQTLANIADNLTNLALNVSNINGSIANLSVELTNLSANYSEEEAQQAAEWAALNNTLNIVTADLNNINGNLTNLSNNFNQEEAVEEVLFGFYNSSLGELTANLTNLSTEFDNLSGVVDVAVANLTDLSTEFDNLSAVVDGDAANLTNLSSEFDKLYSNVSNNTANIQNISDYLITESIAVRDEFRNYADHIVTSNITAVNITTSLLSNSLSENISYVENMIIENYTALDTNMFSNVTDLANSISTNQIDLSSRIDAINGDVSYQIGIASESLTQKIETTKSDIESYVDNALTTINNDIQNLYANDTITVYSENPANFNAYVVFKNVITEDGSGVLNLNSNRIDYYVDYQNIMFTNSPMVTSSLEYIGVDADNAQKVSLTLEQVSSFMFLVRFATLDGTALVHNEWKANIIAYGN